jgi:hypothetical protein
MDRMTHLGQVLHEYANQTAADMGEDFAAACRAMRDEPGEVALAVGMSASNVITWCDEMARLCTVHDADDVVPGRICGHPLPCPEHR